MDLDAMIGMRLAVGFPGTEATPQVIDGLRRIHAKNLVVFSRNFETPDQFRQLVGQLREALGPVWIMVDHEGGPVIRFRNGVTQFPSARDVGRTQSIEAVERQGAVEAAELLALGVAVNLAPCVDVLVEGSDPIIGERSYGTDPEQVAQYACARIRGLQSHGVAACAKHFPGLGAVPRDPHRSLPTIGLGWQTMEEIHLPPFEAAARTGVAMIMSSHVCYPGLGEPEGLPATFSPRLVRDLLRQRLQFNGLILTDDLEMGALKDFGSMQEIAVQATLAGHDMLLICSDLEAAYEAHCGLQEAYEQGRLDSAGLSASADRLVTTRQKYSI
jgi:beta-N-acetylhexosaminidase